MAIEHRELHDLLRSLGLTRRYLGYDYLILILLRLREDERLVEAPTKLLYPEIMGKYGVTISQVDSALRAAARVCWKEGDPARTGRTDPHLPQPSVREFLRLLTRLDREENSLHKTKL